MRARHGATVALAALCALAIAGGAALLDPALAPPLAALAILATAIVGLARVEARGPRDPRLIAAREDLAQRAASAADERLALRLRAETAGRFREEFVAAVRHELKTPLNSILGFTGVLLQEVDGPLTPAQREDVEAIQDAGSYLSGLVEAVLEEWAPSRAAGEVAAAIDLARLLSEVARLLSGQLVDKDVSLVVEVEEGLPPLFADPRRLRQILINLGTNALRATTQGSVRFEAARAGPDRLRITVRDTGRGIADEELPGLFDELTQAGPPESRRGGAGLGLALTRDMVEWHGGEITVESTLGTGSAFHVHLPLEVD